MVTCCEHLFWTLQLAIYMFVWLILLNFGNLLWTCNFFGNLFGNCQWYENESIVGLWLVTVSNCILYLLCIDILWLVWEYWVMCIFCVCPLKLSTCLPHSLLSGWYESCLLAIAYCWVVVLDLFCGNCIMHLVTWLNHWCTYFYQILGTCWLMWLSRWYQISKLV